MPDSSLWELLLCQASKDVTANEPTSLYGFLRCFRACGGSIEVNNGKAKLVPGAEEDRARLVDELGEHRGELNLALSRLCDEIESPW